MHNNPISIPVQLALEAQRDARHTFRLWGMHPWHVGFMIAALALAIGANTGVFSVVNALLLRGLPFHDADRLAALALFQPPHDTASQLDEWRTHSTYVADAAVFEHGDFNIGQDRMVRAHIAQTSNNFFFFWEPMLCWAECFHQMITMPPSSATHSGSSSLPAMSAPWDRFCESTARPLL